MSELSVLPCGGCGRFTAGSEYDVKQCRNCWLCHHDPAHRAALLVAFTKPIPPAGGCADCPSPPPPPPAGPCSLLGGLLTDEEKADNDLYQLRDWRWCHHPRKPLGVAVCECQGCGPKCPGYNNPNGQQGVKVVDGPFNPDLGKRHLLFHILPATKYGGGVWRRAVDQLRLRWPLFTGFKVVAVGTGEMPECTLDAVDAVRSHLPADAIVLPVANNPHIREVASWWPLWGVLADRLGPHDSVFYAHAKGVTRQVDPGNSTHWWASMLYSLNLDHWPRVAALLRTHPIAGAFKKIGTGFDGVPSVWHFSGTFYWLRGQEAIARMRRTPPPDVWWGTEAWPGMVYHPEEAGRLGPFEAVIGELDVYNPERWHYLYRPEYSKWLLQNPPSWSWFPPPARSDTGS